MSVLSEKQRMRDALSTIEAGLGSLIAARYENGTAGFSVEIMTCWRHMARRALGYTVQERECICPKCGIRHGIEHILGDF